MTAPSRKDRRGVRRRRARGDVAPSLLGLVLVVPNRGGDLGSYFSALTHGEYDNRVDDPRRFNFAGRSLAPRGAAGKRDALRRAAMTEALCRCERQLIPVTVGLVESGYQPRCNPGCEVRRGRKRGEDAR